MAVFPVLLDSQVPYLRARRDVSIALLPYGGVSLAAHVSDQLLQQAKRRPRIVRTFDGSPEYEAAVGATGAFVGPSESLAEFYTSLDAFEPSDWILFVDPRCFPENGDLAPLLEGLSETPRITRHLVALDWNAGGTNERVELDSSGRIRRVQRYYDAVTWTMTAGICASLVPVSTIDTCTKPNFTSLEEFRRSLSTQSVFCRDIPHRGDVFDLETERGLLRLTGRVLASTAASEPHASARLLGPVVIHPTASVADDVTIIGPSVIGANARLERGVLVAQSVVVAGAVLSAGSVVRHRVYAGPDAEFGASPDLSSAIDADDEMPRLLEEHRRRSLYPAIKLTVEVLVAVVALLLLSPLLLLVAVIVKLESTGPVLYGDPREAKDGRLFACFKFRTMVAGADAAQRDLMAENQMDGPQFKMTHDPRITRIGRLLRASSLDELPQLINVALGQMSLVGPRPSPFRENQTCVPWRDARLSVRPGITGLWQVCRHNREGGDFHQWIYYDIQYVKHMSPLVDLKILIATLLTGGGRSHVPLSWIVSSGHEPLGH